MKIVLFTENNFCGGLDSFIVTLVNSWPHAEDDLVLVCNRAHPGLAVIAERTRRKLTIRAHALPMALDMLERLRRLPGGRLWSKAVSPVLRYIAFARHLRGIRELLRAEAPDRVMVVNGGYPGGDTCRAAVLAWDRLRGDRPAAIHNIHSLTSAPRWWEKPLEDAIDRRVAAATLALVAVSRACAASVPERRSLAVPARLRVIHNGIAAPDDAPTPVLRTLLDIGPEIPLALMLGTYELHKGHEFLLRAWQRVVATRPEARLVIAGFGYPPQVEHVRGLVSRLGLADSVTLLGFRSDVAAMIAGCDVMLLPSQAFESFGLTLVEAMAQCRPVVATAMGGIPEVVGEDEAGFVVPHHDDALFARRILDLFADAGLRDRLGRQGQARYRRLFTAQRMADDYAALVRGKAAL